ncbi:MAG: N-acetyltransferase [Clostridiales bacterium]|jgi:L-amino acid N-acyltransferase YncA|nr:N-acetyltransferase [Clostridiales bacterium]
MKQAKLRLARPADAEGVLKVYAPYIKETAISFEYDVPTPDELAGKIESIGGRYPFLVCELEGEIIGFAYASAHMTRSACMWNAELLVYIDERYLRRGIGHSLYSALMEMLRLQNIQNVYGAVTIPNESSEWLHKSMGFDVVGTYRKAAFKLGRWHDVVWYGKQLGSYITPPRTLIPIAEIDDDQITEILKKNGKMVRFSGR